MGHEHAVAASFVGEGSCAGNSTVKIPCHSVILDVFEPTVFIEDPCGVGGRGDSLAGAFSDYLDTLDFQRTALASLELTPGAERLRVAIERMLA